MDAVCRDDGVFRETPQRAAQAAILEDLNNNPVGGRIDARMTTTMARHAIDDELERSADEVAAGAKEAWSAR
jgi:hypothetical protein